MIGVWKPCLPLTISSASGYLTLQCVSEVCPLFTLYTYPCTLYAMSKDRIFNAAKTVLEQEGVVGLSMRRIAQQSGMSPMSLYRHFADKDALLNALMADGLAAWEQRVRAIHTKAPLQWLERLTDEFLSFALEEPHRFDAAFFLPAPKARQYPDDFAAGRSPVIAMAVLKIEQAQADGLLGGAQALDVALALSALGQGLVSMHRARRFSSDAEFSVLYRSVLRRSLKSLSIEPKRKSK
jgi:AcrR family transcriptional regulator